MSDTAPHRVRSTDPSRESPTSDPCHASTDELRDATTDSKHVVPSSRQVAFLSSAQAPSG